MLKDSPAYLAGQSNKEAILLMHSLTDSNAIMAELAHGLNDEGYSVYYPNFSYHAEGDIEQIMQTHFETYQKDGELFLSQLREKGHEEIIVGGMSLGGLVAFDLASQHPDLKAVISLSTPIFTDMTATKVTYMVRQRYFQTLNRPPQASDRQEAEYLSQQFEESLRSFNHWMEEVFDQLRQLDIAVFIGQANDDEVMDSQIASRLDRVLSQSSYKELKFYDHAGHYLVSETNLKALQQDLIHFLEQI